MIPTRHLAAATLAALLSITGCDSNTPPNPGGSPTPSAAPTTPAPPPDGGQYTTATDLITALHQAGIDCTGYTEVPGAIDALTRGSCNIAGRETVVSIYATYDDARAHPETMAAMLEGVDDVDMVVGRNWTVSCETQDDCTRVDQALGGQLHHIPQ